MFITQIITRKSGLILYTKSCSTAQNRPLEFKRGVLSPNNVIDESLCSIIFSTDVTIRRIKGQFSIEAEINHAIKAPALIQQSQQNTFYKCDLNDNTATLLLIQHGNEITECIFATKNWAKKHHALYWSCTTNVHLRIMLVHHQGATQFKKHKKPLNSFR